MSGGSSLNTFYVLARRTLLDALDALQEHRDAVILVGAQAIYLHTGASDLSVELFTTDADLALDPALLGTVPALEQAMQGAGFTQRDPGIWTSQKDSVNVDLLVPEAVGGPGRRGARLTGHSDRAARKAKGLEAALVDREPMSISSLEASDTRRIEVAVAGPGALLVAKLHKLGERRDDARRRRPKDALDVYRLLQKIPTQTLQERFERLQQEPVSSNVTIEAQTFLEELFGSVNALGSQLAAQSVGPLDDPDLIAASCAALAQDLLAALHP